MKYEIDATNKKLGRLASEIAVILQGKKVAAFEPRLVGEDSVLVKNIEKMEVTGKKYTQKKYYHHTTQIGHLREETMRMVWEKRGPGEVLRRAIMGMLPKNRLRVARMKKLKIM